MSRAFSGLCRVQDVAENQSLALLMLVERISGEPGGGNRIGECHQQVNKDRRVHIQNQKAEQDVNYDWL